MGAAGPCASPNATAGRVISVKNAGAAKEEALRSLHSLQGARPAHPKSSCHVKQNSVGAKTCGRAGAEGQRKEGKASTKEEGWLEKKGKEIGRRREGRRWQCGGLRKRRETGKGPKTD